ncbi:MAG: hypothetical protein KAV43_01490 [Hadesarchaea archaeon]|nr:hypothetical protein [Hadesarchaea archaeon]
MGDEPTFEAVLTAIDRLLELSPREVSSGGELWTKLDNMLDGLLGAAKFDAARHGRLAELVASLKAAAARFHQSLLNARRGGPLRDDWARFVERDFIKLKDEVLALKEFLVGETDFLKFACLRARLRDLGRINPEKLFEELHEEQAISERTWVLLMAQPNTWQKALKDREVSGELARISGWLLDLQEARRERRCLARKTAR